MEIAEMPLLPWPLALPAHPLRCCLATTAWHLALLGFPSLSHQKPPGSGQSQALLALCECPYAHCTVSALWAAVCGQSSPRAAGPQQLSPVLTVQQGRYCGPGLGVRPCRLFSWVRMGAPSPFPCGRALGCTLGLQWATARRCPGCRC